MLLPKPQMGREWNFGVQYQEPEEIMKAPIRHILKYIKNIDLVV